MFILSMEPVFLNPMLLMKLLWWGSYGFSFDAYSFYLKVLELLGLTAFITLPILLLYF